MYQGSWEGTFLTLVESVKRSFEIDRVFFGNKLVGLVRIFEIRYFCWE